MAASAVYTAALPGELPATCMHVLCILMSPLAQGQRPRRKCFVEYISELSRSCSARELAVLTTLPFLLQTPNHPLQETRLSQYHNYLNLEDIYDAHRETLQAECLHTVPVSSAYMPSTCSHCACLVCGVARMPLFHPACSHRHA